MRKIDNIVIHCSDSSFGDVRLIDKWHKQRGWKSCGYSYVILNGKRCNSIQYDRYDDGLLENGRELNNDVFMQFDEIGAHAYGFNQNSIGVCLIGKDKFTVKQFETLINLIQYWKSMIPGIKVFGHYDLNNKKTCPNFNIDDLQKLLESVNIKTKIENYMKDYL